MIEELMSRFLPPIIGIIEIMGIFIIVVGTLKAFYHYTISMFKPDKYPIKSAFANTLAMGLEFKLAAEILKTVLVHTISELAVLAAVTLLRAFMIYVLNWELKKENENKYNKNKIESDENK